MKFKYNVLNKTYDEDVFTDIKIHYQVKMSTEIKDYIDASS